MSYSSQEDQPSILESIRFFHRSTRPILLGELSLYVGLSLDRSRMIVNVLLERGIIRHATFDELAAIDVSKNAVAYVLAVQPSLNLAYRG